MKVAVYDTYVQRKDQKLMHFDILVPDSLTDQELIYRYGKAFLDSKGIDHEAFETSKCNFCHVEEVPENIRAEIGSKGHYIVELENCN